MKWDDGKTEQARRWELEDAVPQRLEGKFLPLVTALSNAQKNYDDFVEEFGIDFQKEIDEKTGNSA